jgi:hypothetical protein
MMFARIMFSLVTYTKKKYTKTKNGFSKDYLEPHFCVGKNTTYVLTKFYMSVEINFDYMYTKIQIFFETST